MPLLSRPLGRAVGLINRKNPAFPRDPSFLARTGPLSMDGCWAIWRVYSGVIWKTAYAPRDDGALAVGWALGRVGGIRRSYRRRAIGAWFRGGWVISGDKSLLATTGR